MSLLGDGGAHEDSGHEGRRRGKVGTRIGAMAQLVARFHGMEEATGSNPVSSTTSNTIY